MTNEEKYRAVLEAIAALQVKPPREGMGGSPDGCCRMDVERAYFHVAEMARAALGGGK